MGDVRNTILPFLTFAGNADEAMRFYVATFPRSRVLSLTGVDDVGLGEETKAAKGRLAGKVLNARMELKGCEIMLMDIDPSVAQPFTWAFSLYVSCDDEPEFDRLFETLSVGGNVIMGPAPILALRKVAWVTDRFGVTWQLVWE